MPNHDEPPALAPGAKIAAEHLMFLSGRPDGYDLVRAFNDALDVATADERADLMDLADLVLPDDGRPNDDPDARDVRDFADKLRAFWERRDHRPHESRLDVSRVRSRSLPL